MTVQGKKDTGILAAIDGVIALSLALAAVLIGNRARIPTGAVHQFLEMRITIANAAFAGLFMFLWSSCFRALHLFRPEVHNVSRKLVRIAQGSALMSVVLGLFLYGSHTSGPTRRIAAIFFCLAFAYEAARVLGATWIASRDPKFVVILGTGRRATKAWRQIRTQYHFTVQLVGFVDDRHTSEMSPDVADRYLGSIDDLNDLLLRNVVDELIIAMPMKSCYEKVQRAIGIAEQVGVQVIYMPDMYSLRSKQPSSQAQESFSELIPSPEHYVTRQAVKRLIDFLGALCGLIVLSPLFLAVAIAIRLTSKGPVFFIQQRFGYRRRLFPIYKFRSMVQNAPALMAQLEHKNEADGPIFKIKDDPRITPLGKFLRASSIDELPQLINVFLGHMSLVGPRPMSVRDVSLFSEATLMRRFTVRPGITGLWQVSGRSSVSFEQWIKMDFNYIDDWSLALDFQILAKTVGVVVKRTGAS